MKDRTIFKLCRLYKCINETDDKERVIELWRKTKDYGTDEERDFIKSCIYLNHKVTAEQIGRAYQILTEVKKKK